MICPAGERRNLIQADRRPPVTGPSEEAFEGTTRMIGTVRAQPLETRSERVKDKQSENKHYKVVCLTFATAGADMKDVALQSALMGG